MTESEAQTKWCPFARIVFEQFNIAGNRLNSITSTIPDPSRCIGSECMAWRWNEPTCRKKEEGTIHSLRMLDSEWGEKYERMPDTGYCGLAGKE